MSRYFLKKIGSIAVALLIASSVYAEEPYIKVQIMPLEGRISTSTVTTSTVTGWVTCPTVAMSGRKELTIVNMSETDIAYISGNTGNTVMYWYPLYPRQSITLKAADNLLIFASSSTVVNLRCLEIK